MKKFILGFLAGAILMCAIPTLAANNMVQALFNGVKVNVNGEQIQFKSGEEPAMINDRTYVPAKYVAEALGAKVNWDGKNNTVNIDKTEGKTITEPDKPSTDISKPTSWTKKPTTADINKMVNSSDTPIIPTTSKDDPQPYDNSDRHININGEYKSIDEKTSDGFHVYQYKKNPQKFVLYDEIGPHYLNVQLTDAQGCGYGNEKKIYALIRKTDKKELIHEVEYIVMNSNKFITLDYYENTMLPIIKAEQK
jgi:hypothetical protein